MPKLKYRQYLMETLKDTKEADAYLQAYMDDEDIDGFLGALKEVIEAQGGMSRISKKTHLDRAGLYRMFSEKGNPSFRNIVQVTNVLGIKLVPKFDKLHKQAA